MLSHFNRMTAVMIMLGCLLSLPFTGCGSTTAPVGVQDDGLEQAEADKATEDYVSGEEGI